MFVTRLVARAGCCRRDKHRGSSSRRKGRQQRRTTASEQQGKDMIRQAASERAPRLRRRKDSRRLGAPAGVGTSALGSPVKGRSKGPSKHCGWGRRKSGRGRRRKTTAWGQQGSTAWGRKQAVGREEGQTVLGKSATSQREWEGSGGGASETSSPTRAGWGAAHARSGQQRVLHGFGAHY